MAGLFPSRVTIRDPRSRWGSCTPSGTVMVSWRLVMAPPEVQRHVVAHEVAHLRHLDHGPGFRQLLVALDPDADEHAVWLKRNGAALMRAGSAS